MLLHILHYHVVAYIYLLPFHSISLSRIRVKERYNNNRDIKNKNKRDDIDIDGVEGKSIGQR